MTNEILTNEPEVGATAQEQGSAAPEIEADAGLTTGDGLAGSGQEDEEGGEDSASSDPQSLEEIELDGELRVQVAREQAAKLREGFLRQADYTRKTQEVAELRRAVEAERLSLHQSGAAEAEARARVIAIDGQIARFEAIDWDSWEESDPFEAQKGWRQYQQLQQNRGAAAGQLVQQIQSRSLEAQREAARRVEEGRTVLARDIEGWSPQLAETLLETGVSAYGFDRAEIEEFSDPRMVKVLHDAHQYRILSEQRRQARTHAAAQTSRPAARLGGASPKPGLDDRLGADEWMRRRNEQARKRR